MTNNITKHRKQVLELRAQGKTIDAIAKEVGISSASTSRLIRRSRTTRRRVITPTTTPANVVRVILDSGLSDTDKLIVLDAIT